MSKITDETINKWLKSIETAGTSANAFGWFMLAVAPLLILILSSSSDFNMFTVLTMWAFLVVLTGLYITTGKFIKNMSNEHVGKYLLFNAFSSIILVQGILPLILCIQSFVGYFNFRKLVKNTDIVIKIDEEKSKISTKEILIFIIIAIVGTVVIVFTLSSSKQNNVNTPTVPALSAENAKKQALADSLTAQYEACSSELVNKRNSVDQTSQNEIDIYNAELASCESVRVKQNAAVESYNSAIGQ